MMMAGTASGYYYCAEYVMDYHGHAANLYLSGLDAQGFYDEMYWLPNWNPKFPLMGNDSAWEKHWKDPSVMGGIDSEWVDSAHFAYFSGHGSEVGLEFGTMNDDYTCQYLDAKWGNTQLDWVALDACKILNETTFGYWMGVLHSVVCTPYWASILKVVDLQTEARYSSGTWLAHMATRRRQLKRHGSMQQI